MPAHHHRSGSLRQSNKRHKTSGGASSKRARDRGAGGKVAGGRRAGPKGKKGGSKSKDDRLHAARQRREASRKKLVEGRRNAASASIAAGSAAGSAAALAEERRRRRGGDGIVPRLVGIISLSDAESELEEALRTFLAGGADARDGTRGSAAITARFDAHKKTPDGGVLTVLTNSAAFRGLYSADKDDGDEDASVGAALDLCRVCDLVLFAVDGSDASRHPGGRHPSDMSVGGHSHATGRTGATGASSAAERLGDDLISRRGDRVLAAVKAQGLPTPLTVLVHREGGKLSPEGREEEDDDDGDCGMTSLTSQSVKSARRAELRRRSELRKFLTRFAAAEFGEGARSAEIDVPAVDNDADAMEEDESQTTGSAGGASSSLTRSKKLLPDGGRTSVDAHPTRTALIRTLCSCAASPPRWVRSAPRPYLVADGSPHAYDATRRELTLTGYIRSNGAPWDVNALVHVPNLGTFAAKRIERAARNMTAAGRRGGNGVSVDRSDGVGVVESDPAKRESLDGFASPDALEGEQNLIGFDEAEEHRFDDDDDEGRGGNGGGGDGDEPRGVARPAGWSDYQSAWLDAVDDADADADGEDDDDVDHGELARALNAKSGATAATGGGGDMDLDDANFASAEERRAELERRRRDRASELEFPDEVEVREDENARDRYQRYRSLKSFRKSHWDPKENLPDDYGTVFHFSSFRATRGDVMAECTDLAEAGRESKWRRWYGTPPSKTRADEDAMEDESEEDEEAEEMLEGCVPPGAHVALTLEGVPPSAYARLPTADKESSAPLLTAVQLLPHENKVSVLHMGVSHTNGCDLIRSHKQRQQTEGGDDEDEDSDPVKSKDVLTFRCGWRTWSSRPVFSQHNLNSDKHKFERYLPADEMGAGAHVAASCYGPVTYGPCPALVFRERGGDKVDTCGDGDGNGGREEGAPARRGARRRQMVAVGSVLGANADRIVVKRVVMTGYPVRVHKRTATVKYMFYNPEDVKWFKPAGLTTKHGLRGNIVESVGEHGTMKCLFNAPIKQHDTVCLPLYKRVYPKYAPVAGGEDAAGANGGATAVSTRKRDLVVL